MSRALRIPVKITGAGRTDTGVNARLMVAHFDLPQPIADKAALCRSLNAMVGPDIAIEGIYEVAPDAHARFNATQAPFNLDMMNRAAAMLLDIDDFTSFAKLHSDNKTNICNVTHAEWSTVDGDASRHAFVITADRFLRNMVRAVVGTLIEVGRGKMTLDQFKKVVEAHDRCAAGTSMPPQPLFLWISSLGPSVKIGERSLKISCVEYVQHLGS